jgi:Putative 2OG-Fe(II) oxygenase
MPPSIDARRRGSALPIFLTTLQPQVVPLFATPFGVVRLPDAERLNDPLAALLTRYATPERADPAATRAGSFRSRDDLYDWPDELIRKATREITAAAVGVIRSINTLTDEQFAALRLQSRAWFTIVRTNGCVPSGSHSNAAWCAIYCVSAPPPSPERTDSGVLRLHETSRATMFSDATNSVTRLPYTPGHSTWRPEPGLVVVFPASIVHEIALLRSQGDLVLMTALLRFVGAGQTGMPWW